MDSSFNTSHVTVQLEHVENAEGADIPFQYIPCYCSTDIVQVLKDLGFEFQYIPCYCSTTMQTTNLTSWWSFNTSHVTVQLCKLSCNLYLPWFQYIPCYCSTIPMLNTDINLLAVSIHPMLLFNYKTVDTLKQIKAGFNTSHVTVQRKFNWKPKYLRKVSIHPMLLFNEGEASFNSELQKFQYIPCYCSTSIP